jgi:dihydrofolate synthase/folylpolyglutamate synthase
LAHQGEVHPQTIDLGLDRSRRVLERLSWRQPTVPVITVAGTNGKGSVTAYCAAILAAAGLRVGTFTSPHLRDYRERIRLHDRLVTEAELIRAFERIEAARLPGPAPADEPVSLTFFEYNAIAAFLVFEATAMDAWVLEVGMGGRLDAVNLVDCEVAVVVSIGLDHQEFLGSTLEAIAREKAGVFRRDRAAIFGSRDMPPALLDCAVAAGAAPKRLGVDFDYTRSAGSWRYRGPRWQFDELPPPALAGGTQFANAAAAIAALEELAPRVNVSEDHVVAGLTSVGLVGRFQVIATGAGPTWILDVAHNPDAARVLAANLRELPTTGRTLAVCGILADKDAPAIADEVAACVDAWWVAQTDGPRGTSAAELALRIAGHVAGPVLTAGSIADGCAAAAAVAGPSDRIVVFGSFHTVGPALDWLETQGLLPRAVVHEYTELPRPP